MSIALARIELPDYARLPTGPRARAGVLALGAVLLWATWPMLATFAAPAPPLLVFGLASAVGFSAAFLRAASGGQARSFLAVKPHAALFVAGGLFVNNVLYLMAMPRIGPAEANVVAYLWPVMLVVMGALAGRSRLGVPQLGGILLAFAGAAIVIGPRLGGVLDVGGYLLAFGSGLVFAIYALVRSYARETRDVIGPSLGLMALAGLVGHVLFEAPAALSGVQVLAIVGVGLAPLSFSNVLWDRASRTGQLALISAIAYFTPLAALLLLSLTGAATVSLATALGAALTVAGALLAAGLLGSNKGSTR